MTFMTHNTRLTLVQYICFKLIWVKITAELPNSNCKTVTWVAVIKDRTLNPVGNESNIKSTRRICNLSFYKAIFNDYAVLHHKDPDWLGG